MNPQALVDTHQHLWDLAQFPYTWCTGIPALNRSFSQADYTAAADGLGIVKTVFMECDVDEPHVLAEALHVQSLAGRDPSIAGIVAGCRPENEGFADDLAELARIPRLRGVRRVLHTQPDEVCVQPRFVGNIRLLGGRGLTFDLCLLARQLPQGHRLAEQCPGVQFVLDHCGVPDVKGRAFDPWRGDIERMAALPNVVCKISGLVAYADPATWTPGELKPWVDHVIRVFGWDRVVWGGDWPVCTLSAPLAGWVGATREIVRDATDGQRAGFFRLNAERIYHV